MHTLKFGICDVIDRYIFCYIGDAGELQRTPRARHHFTCSNELVFRVQIVILTQPEALGIFMASKKSFRDSEVVGCNSGGDSSEKKG